MSDAFEGNVTANGHEISDFHCIVGCMIGAEHFAEYAAHSINSHDELVQVNQELLAALELAGASLSDAATKMKWSDIPTAQAMLRNADAIDAAIAKAKGD
jgi:hypothetical protein